MNSLEEWYDERKKFLFDFLETLNGRIGYLKADLGKMQNTKEEIEKKLVVLDEVSEYIK